MLPSTAKGCIILLLFSTILLFNLKITNIGRNDRLYGISLIGEFAKFALHSIIIPPNTNHLIPVITI